VRTRRGLFGWLLVVGGGATLLLGGAGWAEGAAARSRARAMWDAREAERVVSLARASLDGIPVPASRPLGAPVVRLRIPSIGLDEIVVEGVGSRQLNAGPGHIPETPLPGEKGNAAISAHRDRHFSEFGALKVGDTILTETDTRRTRWLVVSTRIVGKDDPAIFRTSEPTLTLTTCWPIRWFGSAPRRLIVTAKPVDAR
jgi:sortase A